nr:uncharacterized protein LOC118679756 [Bactrocera oleae]
MQKLIFLIHSVAFCCLHTLPLPEPQDFQTGALMLAGQKKEVLDNGAAAHDQKQFEFMGIKVSNDMVFGFGDALKMPGRRRRLEVDPQPTEADNSISNDADYSFHTEYIDCVPYIENEERKKRGASRHSSSQSSSSYSSSDSSFSSLASSSESEER